MFSSHPVELRCSGAQPKNCCGCGSIRWKQADFSLAHAIILNLVLQWHREAVFLNEDLSKTTTFLFCESMVKIKDLLWLVSKASTPSQKHRRNRRQEKRFTHLWKGFDVVLCESK